MAILKNTTISDTGFLRLPVGTTAQRPESPDNGMIRYNVNNSVLEYWNGSSWVDLTDTSNFVPAFTRYTYSIGADTTSVSGADANGNTLSYVISNTNQIEVYVNGIKLVSGASNDYTATTGNSISFNYTIPSGSVVEIQVYSLLPTSTIQTQWTTSGSNIYYNTGKVGIGTDTPQYALHVKNNVTGNGVNGTIIADRVNNVNYESALNWATNGTKQWFFGLDNDSTENLYMYHWQGQGNIFKINASDGRIESQKDYRGLTYQQLTTPTTWSVTYSSQTDVTINVNTQFGVPSTAKAILVTGYYHVTGYGSSGNGDHAVSMFRPNNTWSGSSPWSFTTSSDTGWGQYVLEHDGDASGAVHYYGAWGYNGIIGVNPNGNIYGRVGWGLSGGTHYNTLWCWGYWI